MARKGTTIYDETQSVAMEVTEDAILQFRFVKQERDEAGNIVGQSFHRTLLEPGEPLHHQMDAVNAHLEQMGYDPVSQGDIGKMQAKVNQYHTPEAIGKYKLKKQALEDDRRAGATL